MMTLLSCGHNVKIEGTLSSASSEVVIKRLDFDKVTVLDTLELDDKGQFSFGYDVEKNQPEFIYIYSAGKKQASLLVKAGDRISVVSDTLGNVVITGSDESQKFTTMDKEHAAISASFASFSRELETADDARMQELVEEMSKKYRSYYTTCAKYVMENCHSLIVVPVLFQKIGEMELFGQNTDAIIFKNVADSLETVYTDSKYVKALRNSADKRFANMSFQAMVDNAEVIGFPDITLPDMKGEMVSLSDVDSKVIILYFTTVTEASQNRLSVDVLKPLYQEMHEKGLEIYQVSLDPDKVAWATTIKGQELPWINVCDSRGASSPYLVSYALNSLPALYVIANGELVDGGVVDEDSLKKLIKNLLP